MRYILDNMTPLELELAKIQINWSNRVFGRKKYPETDQEIIEAEGVDLEAERDH